ncbi:hypothetical protein AAMO2058_001109600 [Amorphochlora amoebiformis]
MQPRDRTIGSKMRAKGYLQTMALMLAIVLTIQTLGDFFSDGSGGVGRLPRIPPEQPQLGKLNLKVELMPLLSKKLPQFKLKLGDYNFKPPSIDDIDLPDFLPPLAPSGSMIEWSAGGNVQNSSNLMLPGRQIWVVTTATLPWKTGTAVNPTLRAGYLLRLTPAKKVTLMVPWVEAVDQKKVFGRVKYRNSNEQEADIRKWLRVEAGMSDVANKLHIKFYNGRYHPEYGSIFPVENMLAIIPPEEADVAVLEEPEHLNWFHPETSEYWRARFNHVVGIVHTNYLVYTSTFAGGYYKKYLLYLLNRWLVPAHCHKVIKLSGVLQRYSNHKETVENVHGVREEFLKIGDRSQKRGFKKGFYFIGKALKQKGLPELYDLIRPPIQPSITTRLSVNGISQGVESSIQNNINSLSILPALANAPRAESIVFQLQPKGSFKASKFPENGCKPNQQNQASNAHKPEVKSWSKGRKKEFKEAIVDLEMDIYGSGPDEKILKEMSEERGLNLTFFPGIDHPELKDYKTMINPSVSEVLCTTSAEALAMGKFVILPKHESNKFFEQFPNALMYSTPDEFREKIKYAKEHDPKPLTPQVRNMLTWEAATKRFIQAAQTTDRMAQIGWQDDVGASFHTWLGKGKKGNAIRRIAGAAPLLDPR